MRTWQKISLWNFSCQINFNFNAFYFSSNMRVGSSNSRRAAGGNKNKIKVNWKVRSFNQNIKKHQHSLTWRGAEQFSDYFFIADWKGRVDRRIDEKFCFRFYLWKLIHNTNVEHEHENLVFWWVKVTRKTFKIVLLHHKS